MKTQTHTITIPVSGSLTDATDAAKFQWIQAQRLPHESYTALAKRLGVSQRTIARWAQRDGIRSQKRHPSAEARLPVPSPIVWRADEALAFRSPIVYVFVKNGAVLYVGASAKGIMRFMALRTNHHKTRERDAATHIHIYPCPDRATALKLEKQLLADGI